MKREEKNTRGKLESHEKTKVFTTETVGVVSVIREQGEESFTRKHCHKDHCVTRCEKRSISGNELKEIKKLEKEMVGEGREEEEEEEEEEGEEG